MAHDRPPPLITDGNVGFPGVSIYTAVYPPEFDDATILADLTDRNIIRSPASGPFIVGNAGARQFTDVRVRRSRLAGSMRPTIATVLTIYEGDHDAAFDWLAAQAWKN